MASLPWRNYRKRQAILAIVLEPPSVVQSKRGMSRLNSRPRFVVAEANRTRENQESMWGLHRIS